MLNHSPLSIYAALNRVDTKFNKMVILPKLEKELTAREMNVNNSTYRDIEKTYKELGFMHSVNVERTYSFINPNKGFLKSLRKDPSVEDGKPRKFDFRVLHRSEVIDSLDLEKDAVLSNGDLIDHYESENTPVDGEVAKDLIISGRCPVTQHDISTVVLHYINSKVPTIELARILTNFPELDPKVSTQGIKDKRLSLSDLVTANISYALMPSFAGKSIAVKDKKAFRKYAGKSIFINDRQLKKDSLTVIIFPNKTFTANPTFCKELEESIMSALTFTNSSKVYLFNAPTNLLALTNLPSLNVEVSENE